MPVWFSFLKKDRNRFSPFVVNGNLKGGEGRDVRTLLLDRGSAICSPGLARRHRRCVALGLVGAGPAGARALAAGWRPASRLRPGCGGKVGHGGGGRPGQTLSSCGGGGRRRGREQAPAGERERCRAPRLRSVRAHAARVRWEGVGAEKQRAGWWRKAEGLAVLALDFISSSHLRGQADTAFR